jgi:serine protease
MRSTLATLVAFLFLVLALPASAAPIRGLDRPTRIPNDYIVVLRDAEGSTARAHVVASEWQQRHAIEVVLAYTSALNGLNIRADDATILAIAADPRVAYVEVNERGVAGQGERLQRGEHSPRYTEPTQSWGLDRIDERAFPLDGQYTLARNGARTHVYVIDSGVSPIQAEFDNRVTGGVSFIGDGRGTGDCNSHGTSTAALIGGRTWGIAKLANLHPVRIFGCSNDVDKAKIIAGLDWVRANHVKPAVASLGVGGRWLIGSLEEAANRLIDSGVVLVGGVANNGAQECDYRFPETVSRAVIAGASTYWDQRLSISNYGPCVDVYAPGEFVLTIDHAGEVLSRTGTSAAIAHVAGVAALYMDSNVPPPASEVGPFITATATRHVLSGVSSATNRLLYALLDRPEGLDPNGTDMPRNISVVNERCRGLNTVRWQAPAQAGPFTYELWLSAYPDFQSSYLSHTTTATEQLISIPVGSTRHVRVRAIKAGNDPSYYLTSESPATSITGCE